MPYKTILVHADQSRHAAERIRIAAAIALSENAHLVGAAVTGISRYFFESGALDLRSPELAHHLALLRERAAHGLAQFESIAAGMGLPSYEKRVLDDEVGDGLSLQARYSDLVVVGQTDLNEPAPNTITDLPEYVAMNGGRPVLIIPYAGHFEHVGERTLIAWNGSVEAARAVAGALPLLAQADNVDVVVLNASDQPGVHGEVPGADIAQYLARHGVKVNVLQQTADIDTGAALLSVAADRSSNLLVMGCYGHSRFREILLGGVTRTILESMTLPVLMSH